MSKEELAQVFAPRSVQTGKPIELAMQRLWLVGRITGVGARLLVRHVFRSGEKKPLEIIYSFMLPRDAALRRFRIAGKGFSVASELKPVEKVRETYEEALAAGHTAAMAAQYADGMVNLTVGNIRPGEEVTVNLEVIAGVESRDDGARFRFPFTLAPAYHARARAAEVAPGVGEIELPADEFGDLALPQFVSDASALHEVGFDLSVSMGQPIVETASPSHGVRVVAQGIGRSRVSLATAKDLPDRDLVLDIRTSGTVGGAVAGTARDGRGHFVALIPSSSFKEEGAGTEKEEPRRVVFVLDRSGSMEGAPIRQARAAVNACLGALGAADGFGIVAFDDQVEAFGAGLLDASMGNREKARAFLERVDARGGTELAAGVSAAADMLRRSGGGGDILVVTDGQVAGTADILGVARANGARIHALGIGSASQDRFLTLLARETGGVSRFVTPRERVDMSAVELFASIGRPLGSGLAARVEGFGDARIAPDVPAFVFGGTPIVVYGDTAGAGEGKIVLEWEAGKRKRTLEVPVKIGGSGEGETLKLLQGARIITDMESRYSGGDDPSGREGRREADRVKKRLVALSEAYGLASREMGLVAVVERVGDRPGDIPVTKVVPVGLAQDVEMGAYFGGGPNLMLCRSVSGGRGMLASIFGKRQFTLAEPAVGSRDQLDANNVLHLADLQGDAGEAPLLDLASSLEPDGGMPGKDEEERVLATVLALLQFLAAGHSAKTGSFRAHVARMAGFLGSELERLRQDGEPNERSKDRCYVLEEILKRGGSGRALAGEWDKAKPGPDLWAELREAIKNAGGA